MSKIKNGGLDHYGAEPFERQQFGTAGVERVNLRSELSWTLFKSYNVIGFSLSKISLMAEYYKLVGNGLDLQQMSASLKSSTGTSLSKSYAPPPRCLSVVVLDDAAQPTEIKLISRQSWLETWHRRPEIDIHYPANLSLIDRARTGCSSVKV